MGHGVGCHAAHGLGCHVGDMEYVGCHVGTYCGCHVGHLGWDAMWDMRLGVMGWDALRYMGWAAMWDMELVAIWDMGWLPYETCVGCHVEHGGKLCGTLCGRYGVVPCGTWGWMTCGI